MKVDMSARAISTRLERASQLRALCLSLAGPRLKRPWGVPATPNAPKALKEKPGKYKARGLRRRSTGDARG